MNIKKLIIASDSEGSSNSINDNECSDVIVHLFSGRKFIASFFSYKYLNKINHEHVRNGEFLHGDYFWEKNMVLVKECSRDIIEPVVNDLIDEGNFEEAFSEL